MILSILLLAAVGWLLGEEEYVRVNDPTGKYVAVATYQRYRAFLMCAPGGGGDKEGWVTVHGTNGIDYGSIPVPMVSDLYEIRWHDGGAELGIIGEWDFRARSYRYWNEEQTKEIVRQER